MKMFRSLKFHQKRAVKVCAFLFSKKRWKPAARLVIALCVALAVFIVLLYLNFGFLNITGYFEKHDLYQNSIVLFFHTECLYCDKVDDYIRTNDVQKKVEFVKLDVLAADYNRNELQDKAQICGLEIDSIGVPLLWDGPGKKCVIGYVDIIEFFRQKMSKK